MSSAICIVAIGDEVLSGVTLNCNSQLIALALTNRGWAVSEQLVVPDDPRVIERVLKQRLLQGATVVTIGGLGPTLDDHTRETVAHLFHRPLVFSQSVYDSICRRFGPACPTARDQSMQPQGAILFENISGTAPGFFLEDNSLFGGARLFVLPGPTLEMEGVFYNHVIPAYFPLKKRQSRAFRMYGVLESDVDPILRRIQNEVPQMRIGIYPAYDTVTVLFSLLDQAHENVLDQAETTLRNSLTSAVFLDPTNSLEAQVYENLVKRAWTLATAESCTGGTVASRLTGIPGVSSVFVGGIVAYQNSVKREFLGVSSDILKKHGAVSTAVTEQMALVARAKFHADVAVATSGYFGPSGSAVPIPIQESITKNSPVVSNKNWCQDASVGTVCYTIHTPRSVYTTTRHFTGSRSVICEKTVQAVLARLYIETL